VTLREARGDSGDCCLPQINWQSADREQNLENAIVAEFTDEMNGKRSDREGFQQMFAAASRREFDCVLFWLLDRFSREGVYETLQHLQRLTSYGVRHRSFAEQYLDSCGLFRDAVISILATIAKQERIRLSERTIAGLERARSQGRVGGRPRVICNREKVLSLHREGCSLGAIAGQMHLSKTTVSRIVAGAKRLEGIDALG